MIVEYLTESGDWVRDACRHEADGLGVVHVQPDLLGSESVRESAQCRLCGEWFSLPRAGAGLFDGLELVPVVDGDGLEGPCVCSSSGIFNHPAVGVCEGVELAGSMQGGV